MEDLKLNEKLLSSWLSLTTVISNESFVSNMSYNEAIICHILYTQFLNDPKKKLTATDLCKKTNMLKSQMNRTLTSMEKKKLIIRKRSKEDKRNINIELNQLNMEPYLNQHEEILKNVNHIIDKFGQEKTKEIIQLFDELIQTAKEVL
jgi:DNA-binding MarR family transcriptional regulator